MTTYSCKQTFVEEKTHPKLLYGTNQKGPTFKTVKSKFLARPSTTYANSIPQRN